MDKFRRSRWLIVIHKLSTFANKGLDTLDCIPYNERMMNPNDNGNDPTAYERLTNDAMADSRELDDDCEIGLSWEDGYYGNDADGDEFADDWPY